MADFIPAPNAYKKLQDWDESDLERLGIADLLNSAEEAPISDPIDWDVVDDFINSTQPNNDDEFEPEDELEDVEEDFFLYN